MMNAMLLSLLHLSFLDLLVDSCFATKTLFSFGFRLALRQAALRFDDLCAQPRSPIRRGVDLVIHRFVLFHI